MGENAAGEPELARVSCGSLWLWPRARCQNERGEGGNSVGAWHTWFSSLWAACGDGDQTLTVGRESKNLSKNVPI